jgi:hypothetical protein
MAWLGAVEVADMEPIEAAELFAQTPKLQSMGRDMEMEVALIVQELGYLALAITLWRLPAAVVINLPEYRWQRRKLLSRKVRNGKSARLQMQADANICSFLIPFT